MSGEHPRAFVTANGDGLELEFEPGYLVIAALSEDQTRVCYNLGRRGGPYLGLALKVECVEAMLALAKRLYGGAS